MEQLTYLFVLLVSSAIHLSAWDGSGSKPLVLASPTSQKSLDEMKMDPLTFEDSIQHLYNEIGLESYDLSFEVFKYGMIGYYNLQKEGKLNSKNLLSIIDFTKSSTKKRFYTIDLDQLQVKYYTYVSHGKNTGEDKATSFSNTVHSNQSSLGFYVTGETYIGSKGYSLKLDGTENGYNDKIRERAVVMHDAEYVSEYWIKQYGRLGRSQGCPALPKGIAKEVIDSIKNRTAIFAYYNDEKYLRESRYLDLNPVGEPLISSSAAVAE